MYENTYVREMEEYDRLTNYEKQIYKIIKKSRMLKELIKNYSIVNFSANKEMEHDYFNFDVAISESIALNPFVLYSVSGSILRTSYEENMVSIVCLPEDKILSTNVEKNTIVKENMILTEAICMDKGFGKRETKFVCLKVRSPELQKVEKIIVDPTNKIYKLYQTKKIDLVTFCNLVFLQAKESKDVISYENKNGLVKVLSKSFEGRNRN